MTRGLRVTLLAASIGSSMLVAACGFESEVVPTRAPISPQDVVATVTGKPGEGNQGAQLFRTQGCLGCHRVEGQGGTIGPDLSQIGTVAATRKPGMDAAAYLRESIIDPNAHVVESFQPGVMPATYEQTLTPEQIDTLVEFLLDQQ